MLNDTARLRARAAAPRDLWQSIPLDCILCGLAILLAAGLKLAGIFP